MKNINNIKKMFMLLIAIIIIAGIIVICLKGFNYSSLYSKNQRMNIYMTKDFDIKEIENIAKEVLGTNKVEVQLGNTFGTVASIITKEITEENENRLIERINEKYEVEINKESDVILTEIPEANAWELIGKYYSPLVITTIIILIYFIIRFRNQGIMNCIGIPLIILIIENILYISIIGLTRIPVNEFFAIFGLLIYFLTVIYITMKLEKEEF